MKYTLNKLPIKTTNNFKINDIKLELDIPTNYELHDFDINSNELEKIKLNIEEKQNEINTKIGLSFNKYLKVDITIPKYTIIKEPIIFTYNFNNNDTLIDNFNINFEEGSSADIIIRYNSLNSNINFHQLKETTISESNSKGSISIINLLSEESINLVAVENDVKENAKITHNIIDLGGKNRLYNVYTKAKEYNAKNYLNNIYIGNKDNIIDMNYDLKNIGKSSSNCMRVEGALDGFAKKNFRGTIDFIKGSVNAIGEENENCILLSDNARSRSLPQLLCEEENVVGSHGVSSGKVSPDKLFYIMSRGYSKKEAEKLIILANFTNLINEIPSEKIKEEILEKIEDIIK